MQPREEAPKEKIVFSKKDRFWMYLAVGLFLALFAIVLIFGDGIMGSLF